MKNLLFLFLSIILLSSCTNSRIDEPDQPIIVVPEAPKNLVFIIVDDLRFDALSYNGNTIVSTPYIDRIAQEGVSFDNFFATTSLCSPSRASFLTGLLPNNHGVIANQYPLLVNYNIGTILQKAGYKTGYFGKWHIGSNANNDQPQPGFDNWVSFKGQGVYNDGVINIDGQNVNSKGYIAEVLTQFSIDFIKTNYVNGSFMLYVSHKGVHFPFEPDDIDIGKVSSGDLSLPISRRIRKPVVSCIMSKDTLRTLEIMKGYYETLLSIERSTEKIYNTLDSLGILDNTLLIFTSDNGYMLGEFGMLDKRVAYEPSIKLPFFMRFPSCFEAGTRHVENIALNVDLIPTVLDVLGIENTESIPLDGVSMRKLVSGEIERKKFEYRLFETPEFQCFPDIWALRTLDKKLIRNIENDINDEYYNLSQDPFELINDITGKDSLIIKQLSADLDRLLF